MKKNIFNNNDAPTLDLDCEVTDTFQESGPVTVLGMTFADDEERRTYFREQLRAKLPELRQIEGFPIGSDDDIINLSDPPYYTACPNPWLNDFIAEWEQKKLQLEAEGKRHPNVVVNEPYAYPVREKKSNAIYTAHSYHTKVPPEIILKYYLHYTQPGDIVIDNFAGTGMAGVAAKFCNFPTQEILGSIESTWKSLFHTAPNWGVRYAILGDLSPIASFITYNYNKYFDKKKFIKIATEILTKLEDELGYTYQFNLESGESAEINYVVWSEEQICASCGERFVYWDVAIDIQNNIQKEVYQCPHCGTIIKKKNSNKFFNTEFDDVINQSVKTCSFVPVFINYRIGKKRFEKVLSTNERTQMMDLVNTLPLSNAPISKLPKGDKTTDPENIGITYLHQFYTRRNLSILLRFKELIEKTDCDGRLKLFLGAWFTSCQSRLHRMNRYAPKHHRHVGPLANTLYVSATPTEISPFYFIKAKLKENSLDIAPDNSVVNQVASATDVRLSDNSIDYIFTDPPFGANIMYSELNFLLESWLKVQTNNTSEAVSNKTQNKGTLEYLELMTQSFKEYYRILKPGKWMTVEFSNTSNAIWNAIQTSLQNAGFVISAISDLDKGRGGLHGIVGVTAVDQDLAISCYKPLNDFYTCGMQEKNSENVWRFIDEFLSHLPVHLEKDGKTTEIRERRPKTLYDRLVAFYVQNGFQIPYNAQEFQAGLRERYAERDGMYFLPSQAAKYDELRKHTEGFQTTMFFVDSEQGGIAWLNNELVKPQTYQDLQPKWMQAINGVRKGDILPELMQILEENFIKQLDGKWRKPNLQDDVDLAALRHKALMREFKVYVEVAQKPRGKIKEARVEALRAGIKQCYQDKDFATIVAVGDRIPQNLLTEDEQLLQFYEIASSHI